MVFALLRAIQLLEPILEQCTHGWFALWPTGGITLALLLMARRSNWPWLLSVVTVVNLLEGPVKGSYWGYEGSASVCNLIEVLLPAMILPRFDRLNHWLQNPQLVVRFVLYATLAGPFLAAVLIGLYYQHGLHQAYLASVLHWAIADSVGIVIFSPLFLALAGPEIYELFAWRRLAETLGLFGLLAASCWFAFLYSHYPLIFLVTPVLLLITVRLGFSGSVIAINLAAPFATTAARYSLGPFTHLTGSDEPARLILVQLFLILSTLMIFPISVARIQQEHTSAQLEEAYRAMEALAARDGLTGLANRRRFDAALAEEWRRGARDALPVSVLMLDADRFKEYNDRYGHPAGDACLQSIGRAISDIPQRAGDLVARYGGEEFVILLPGVDAGGAFAVAEQVRRNVQSMALPHLDNALGIVTISVGCASLVPSEATELATLLEQADRALYLAKQRGRNRCCIYDGDPVADTTHVSASPALL